jgi:2'-5' RNA ligase
MYKMRLFVSIDLNEELRNRACGIMEDLAGSGADLKIVKPENLHITLKFLGEVREEDVKKISSAISGLSRNFSPFTMELSVLGYFGNPRFPRTVWIGVSRGRETVTVMARELSRVLSFVRTEDREPKPHLTIARVKSVRNAAGLVERIVSNRDVKLGELIVKEISLKKSVLKPDGPSYSNLEVFPLRE